MVNQDFHYDFYLHPVQKELKCIACTIHNGKIVSTDPIIIVCICNLFKQFSLTPEQKCSKDILISPQFPPPPHTCNLETFANQYGFV